MAYAKALRAKLEPLAAQITAITAAAAKDDNRGLTSEEREKWTGLVTDYTALEKDIEIAEKSESIVNKLASIPATPGAKVNEQHVEQLRDEFRITPKNRAERMKDPAYKAFSNYLRHGMGSLDVEDRSIMERRFIQNAQQGTGGAAGGFGSQGGYLIPQGFSNMLEEAKKWFGGIDGTVEKFTTETGNPIPWPTLNDTANRGRIIGQNVQVSETDAVFAQSVTFQSYIGSSDLILIPLALIQDAYFDMDALTARLLGTRLGRLFNWKLTSGTGTNEPTGIVTAAVAAGSTQVFATGGTAGPVYGDLVKTQHKVDPAYRFNSNVRWMFHDLTLQALKLLVDSIGRPLWQPGLTASFRDGAAVDLIAAKPTILDSPYVINQDMDAPAANKNSILYGDMNTYKVREVAGGTTVMRLTERYADYLQVGYIAFQRFDGNLIDAGTHPLAVGVNSAT